MIQKTSGRRSDSATEVQTPDEWGRWIGNRYYSLEVVQHPIRARMCGFGDKDRRPLAPAAVAKMNVRTRDNKLVPVDDIDIAFFLVTVDLWSQDGKQEMNLVLHPSSADRYVPAQVSRPRRRPPPLPPQGPPPSGSQTRSSMPSPSLGYNSADPPPIQPGPTDYGYPYGHHQPPDHSIPLNAPYSLNPPPGGYPMGTPWGYGANPSQMPYTPPGPTLPSIHSFSRSNLSDPQSQSSFRPWSVDPSNPASYGDSQSGDPHGPHTSVDPVHPGFDPMANSSFGSQAPYQPSYPQYQPPQPQTPISDNKSQIAYESRRPSAPASPSPSMPPLPRHTYTRTLVGPLSANACRLQDEHRKPGIFFLFQDLSIRTEGSFRLRMRLINVGAPPAPDSGATEVNTDSTPILAQAFTESFVVYSAKRFPGVPDTTALSIAFGNQGQKLPLRNRHGSGRRGRRQRGGGSDDDEDSASGDD
ncbi:hypothetical protein SISNIDRAFT_59558 [Sistotremastrum niveocremeum HHB9708]|uniref:Velvet domain-containing protein n=2 Tax=Sistotremastraceae TaxID=3402574 RepID=A0A164VFI0_9AGAM|nr:hypothetical protein SISNIDRAFT_59558 [Sistotremastrum niveocremeum HHB9708]KZT35581.1 hypothetical protein SISSUDRAFT_1064379 [Sistotremastrum suecicum HHB10207 ss-3]